MHEDDLHRLFESSGTPIADDGFVTRVIVRVDRLRRRRRFVLGAAWVSGAAIAVAALLGMDSLPLPLPAIHLGSSISGVAALCAYAVAIWWLSLAAEG